MKSNVQTPTEASTWYSATVDKLERIGKACRMVREGHAPMFALAHASFLKGSIGSRCAASGNCQKGEVTLHVFENRQMVNVFISPDFRLAVLEKQGQNLVKDSDCKKVLGL